MEPIELKLTELSTDLKAFAAKAQEETTSVGKIATETKSAIDAIKPQLAALQTQLDALDAKTQQRHVPGAEQKSLGEQITSAPEFLAAKEGGFMSRKAINVQLKSSAFAGMQRKTNILESGFNQPTTGMVTPVRLPGVAGMAQQALRIRDLMNVVPQTTGNSFDFVKQVTRTNAASPQVEGVAKAQSFFNWNSASDAIRTIAHFAKVSRQALDDVPGFRNMIDGEGIYGLKVKEEAEILSGDGTGVHLNGIITQATAFDTATYLAAAVGWTRLDILRWAKLQARLAGLATYAPSAYVLHPTDLAHLETTKDGYGHYIIGDPKTGAAVNMVWGLPAVESDSIAAGTFAVGAFDTAADLVDRQAVSVEISYEDGDNFTTNMATVLFEERIGLAVKVPTAFIKGSFTTSPASQS
jgi:HK97 family phage major capsid protein